MTVDSVTEMTTRRRVEDIVREAIGEINETRSDALPFDKLDSLVLYGVSGILDSLQLVNLLMSIEEKIADRIDVAASLTSDRAVSRRVSPFRSTTHLVDFILEEIGRAAAA
jgi:acyl carrier protein